MKITAGAAISVVLSLMVSACGGEIPKTVASDKIAAGTSVSEAITEQEEENVMKIKVGSREFTAKLADNSSAKAFYELLEKGDLTVDMHDYGNFEKVGDIGTRLPRNDEQITTEAGDIILYQGSSVTIYYDTNSWSFTRLGKIEGVTGKELKDALGSGDVTVTFSVK